MKPTAVLLTVISLVTATLIIAKTTTHGSNVILPQASLKKEIATLLPQPAPKEADSLKAAKEKWTDPKINTIKREKYAISCDTISCGGVMPPPLIEEDYSDSVILSKVEIEAEYPGGPAAWQRYLNRNLRVPQEAIDNEISGSVVVQFVVDEVMRVIRKSGKWTPAMQGGRYVKSLKKQPIIICFAVEE
jgi:protein TonB